MRAEIFTKVSSAFGDRIASTATRVAVVAVSVSTIAFGAAAFAASQSAAAARIDSPAADVQRDVTVSRDVTRTDLSTAELAAARASSLRAAATDLAEAQQADALDQRQEALAESAEQISEESKYLLNRAVFFRPTAGKLGSPYGMRFHPILHYTRLHDGMDIGGACGQPIYAASDGVVVKAAKGGYNGGSGNNVRVDSGTINGHQVEEAYLHMQTIVVSVGQQVQKGDLLGTVGNTGLSTSCHLHFSVYEDGHGVNPAKYLKL